MASKKSLHSLLPLKIGVLLIERLKSHDTNYCPSCGQKIDYSLIGDAGIATTSFIPFLLSSLVRRLDIPKVLVFSDGRQSAESIAQTLIRQEASLMIQAQMCSLLLNNPTYSIHRRGVPLDLSHSVMKHRFLHLPS